ncbi:MAG TPA: hypothetical protein VL588_10855, partial [Bdellovibrionota bacterium]|nr:hypothetical protein [Bdellovibrionota bacterium]
QRLWPAAIVLYVEASPGPPAHDPSVWSGRWIVTSRAGWIPPKETLQNLPASRGSWTRLGP